MKALSSTARPRPAWVRGLAVASLAAGAWALSAGAAQASDVYWSVGVNGPGVSVGVGNAPPVIYHHPRPVYVQPAPIYYQPRPVYVERPYRYGYVQPVVVVPRPVYGPGWRGSRWDDRHDGRRWHGHPRDRGHGRWDDDRRDHGRWDDDRRDHDRR
jgi:hypothetical protein